MMLNEQDLSSNPFLDPQSALQPDSMENLAILDSNSIELPDEDLDDEDNGKDDLLRSEIKSLMGTITSAYWDVSGKLYSVLEQKRYKKWGYEKFEDYADQELGIKRTKAYDLANIFKHFAVVLKDKFDNKQKYQEVISSVKEIGWNKALKIATEKIMDENNAKEIVDFAKNNSLKDLEEKCKEIIDVMPEERKEERKEEVEKTARKGFNLLLWQVDLLESTIDKVKATMREGANDSSALMFIIQDFNAGNSVPKTPGDVSEYLSKVERMLGVKLLATTKDFSKVIFGSEMVSRFSNETEIEENSEQEDSSFQEDSSDESIEEEFLVP